MSESRAADEEEDIPGIEEGEEDDVVIRGEGEEDRDIVGGTQEEASNDLGGEEKDKQALAGEESREPASAPPITFLQTPTDEESEKSSPSLRYMNVGGNFYTGFDVMSEDAVKKRAERSKRFGLDRPSSSDQHDSSSNNQRPSLSKLEARSKKFGTTFLLHEGVPVKLVPSLPPIPPGSVRPEAVHLHGTDDMSTADVFRSFSLYSPRNVEWINDQSCNVVWEDVDSAKRALAGLRRQPVRSQEVEMEEEEKGTVEKREEAMEKEGEEEEESKEMERDEEEGERRIHSKETELVVSKPQKRNEKMKIDRIEHENEIDKNLNREEENPPSEDDLQWWLGPLHPKAEQLLLRRAVTGDVKRQGSAKHSQYYRRHGNPNVQYAQSVPNVASRPKAKDLRGKLKRKRTSSHEEEEEDEEEEVKEEEKKEEEVAMDIQSISASPLKFLANRPKRMHADRTEEEDEEGGGEKERASGGGKEEGVDLRRILKKKRKRRNLKLRLGYSPRLVEDHS